MSRPTDTPEADEQQPLSEYAERAYLDYAMYVVLDRALPNVADGLKPVQRRIVYAMSELGLGPTSKPKKSMRTVGDVLGKYHPHGDLACYEAMVHMAQPFSFRYPLVEGQGNFGTPDNPKAAAARYTEARLTRISQLLLSEVGHGTVDWVPNYDNTMREPRVLPARLPMVLLNGAAGIAVGMATDIPPHNMREVAEAAILLLRNRRATLDELCELIPGPDFPTEAEIITPPHELREIYETGRGSVRARACYDVENGNIVVHTLPYQVSGEKVLEQIAAQMRAKKLPWVEDLRDESDHEHPTRLVIMPRAARSMTTRVERLMSHLFVTTDLEKSYRVNLNLIGLDGRPQVKGLRQILLEWLEFREETVKRRLEHRLDQVEKRLHILAGLLIAHLNIDLVIRIIRTEEKPKPVLMERFGLTDTQAEAILETKLRHLSRLEEMKIRGEIDELERERDALRETLDSTRKLRALLRKEIAEDAQKYGDDRRSPLVERAAAESIAEEDLIPSEPVTVVMSTLGWVRSGKGHELDPTQLNYRTGDAFKAADAGRSNELAAFIDSTGRTYSLPAHTLPSARSNGEPLTGRFTPPAGATFEWVLMGAPESRVLIASSAGYGFVCRRGDWHSRNKSGKQLLSVPTGADVLMPVTVPEDVGGCWLACASSAGYLLLIELGEVPELSRGKGNKLIGIPRAKFESGVESLLDLAVLREGHELLVHAGKRHTRLRGDDLDFYRAERGRRGVKLPRGFRNVDYLEVSGG